MRDAATPDAAGNPTVDLLSLLASALSLARFDADGATELPEACACPLESALGSETTALLLSIGINAATDDFVR